jgi:hypothetical protein
VGTSSVSFLQTTGLISRGGNKDCAKGMKRNARTQTRKPTIRIHRTDDRTKENGTLPGSNIEIATVGETLLGNRTALLL